MSSIRHKRSTIAGLIVILVCAFSINSEAALSHLYQRDLDVVGDALITFDSMTRLEWLDLTETNGSSILGVEASPIFDENGRNGKFRWATVLEIVGLLSHLSWVTVVPGPSIDELQHGTGVVAETEELIDLLGETRSNDLGLRVTAGTSRAIVSGLAYGSAWIVASPPDNDARVDVPRLHDALSEATQIEGVGAWLVRDAVPIPILPTLALFLLPLVLTERLALSRARSLHQREARDRVT